MEKSKKKKKAWGKKKNKKIMSNIVEALSKLKVSTITKSSMYLATVVILVCYWISVHQGAVRPLPHVPMISDCLVVPPTSYISRLGLISAAWLLALNQLAMFFYLRTAVPGQGRKCIDHVAFWVGAFGALGLAGVAACNEDENGVIHGTSAGLFFVGQLIMMFIISFRALGIRRSGATTTTRRNVVLKFTLTITALAVGLAALYFMGNWHRWSTYIAICEWTAVYLVLLFNMTFLSEFGDSLFFAEVLQFDRSLPVALTTNVKVVE
jgi:Frag1/DRAM/Sfk1 family